MGTRVNHADGHVGMVVDVVEQWAFTLEVELDGWKMAGNTGTKIFVPVR